MAAVASPPIDAQPQENGNAHPTPPEQELPSLSKSNASVVPAPAHTTPADPSCSAAVQQNSLADRDATSTDLDSAPAKPDVPSSIPSPPHEIAATAAVPPSSDHVPETPNVDPSTEVVQSHDSAVDDAGGAVLNESLAPPVEPQMNGDSVHATQPETVPSDDVAAESHQDDAGVVDTSMAEAPQQLPDETDTEQAAPASNDEPGIINPDPSTGDSSLSTKIPRERDEDNDVEEPAAKRTKTDESAQESIAPAANISVDTSQALPSATSEALVTPATPGLASSASTKEDWGEMTDTQQKRLIEGMRNLKKGKHASLFSKPVDPVALNLPTYYDLIKEPMDLSTMETKLKNRDYPSVVDYVADFDTMVNNAIRFNGQAHPVAQSGMMIRSQLEAQLRKLPKPGDPAPEPSKPKRTSLPGPTRELQRRESRQSLGAVAQSPSTAFAPDANGVPLVRRDSNVADRPKRKIQRPAPRDLQYPKPQKKKFKAELTFAGEVLAEMERPRYKDVCAAPFLTPVDPVALGIPNYHQIIKKPMDVSTIRQKYHEQQYENLKEFENDFRLMFKNCYKFNPEGHPVNAMGHQYEQIFDEQMAKKNDRVKALAPPSARDSPDDDDEDGEEEEEESEDDEEAQRQKQIAALNEQLKLLQAQTQSLMGQSTTKAAKPTKDKKAKAAKPESSKKKKSSNVGVAPPQKEKKSKSKSKPKNKPLTQKDKEEIASRIFELPTDEINVIADKIKKAMRDRGEVVADESEMEFNIDDIPDDILHEILKKLRNIDSRVAKNGGLKDEDDDYDAKPDASGSYAPKGKRNRPMSRTDTANQMAAIQQQIDSFNGGNAGSPPGKMESSDDDESGSESEEE
ncbi:MAG: hypothetical protein Q9162_005593 [Coniocarpon cinnabarinum]